MHSADLVILAALALSLIFGFMRGFVREAFSLVGWVLAILIARWFNEPVSAWLAQWVGTPSVRLVMSYGTLFFGTLLACGLLGQALSLAVRDRLYWMTTGAYTNSYSAVEFNGFPPLQTYYVK